MVQAAGELERGRESYAASAWLDAYGSLAQVGERFADADLIWLARDDLGSAADAAGDGDLNR